MNKSIVAKQIASVLEQTNSFARIVMSSEIKPMKAQKHVDMFNATFPNGLNRVSACKGSLVGKTAYKTYMSNKLGFEYEPKKASGRTKLDGFNNLFVADKDSKQFYFQIYMTNATNSTSTYEDNNGESIESALVEDFEKCLLKADRPSARREKNKSEKAYLQAKQQNEKVIVTRSPKLETIKEIKVGNFLYTK
jgi:hypothetical protein